MKHTACFSFFLLITVSLVALPLSAQDIYRVVDEHGNVTYTDQKPDDDAEPVTLPELNVLGDEDDLPLAESAPAEDEQAPVLDLAIERPVDGAILPAGDGRVEVEMSVSIDIPATAQIVLFLNDQPQEPVRSMSVMLDQMPPGEYRLRAELQTPGGRPLASSDSIEFRVSAAPDDAGRP